MVDNKIVNKRIGDFFMNDCRCFIKRCELLCEHVTDRGSRCKLLTDVLFALECGLKALYFYKSDKNEKETYKDLRNNYGHNISKLFENFTDNITFKELYDNFKKLNLMIME